MKPNNITTIGGIVLALGSGAASAADFVDHAQVISATPIVVRVSEPHQECTTQTVITPTQPQGNGIVGGIIGGVAGGLLGAQIGHGSGKTAATIVGAAGGAIVGNQVANANTPPSATAQPVQTCNTVVSEHDVVRGYTIVYRYNGRDVTTALPYNPGSFVKVGVGVIDEGITRPPRRDDDGYPPPPPSYPPPPPPGY